MARGNLTDAHLAALQRDRLGHEPDRLLGVVRRPTAQFAAAVDENDPRLAPPASLIDRVAQERDDMKMRGMCEEGAHNAAWENLKVAERYRQRLADAESAQCAVDEVAAAVADGQTVTLVGYENTAKKRCHRTILREEIESRLQG